jgi:hypothetical protein
MSHSSQWKLIEPNSTILYNIYYKDLNLNCTNIIKPLPKICIVLHHYGIIHTRFDTFQNIIKEYGRPIDVIETPSHIYMSYIKFIRVDLMNSNDLTLLATMYMKHLEQIMHVVGKTILSHPLFISVFNSQNITKIDYIRSIYILKNNLSKLPILYLCLKVQAIELAELNKKILQNHLLFVIMNLESNSIVLN